MEVGRVLVAQLNPLGYFSLGSTPLLERGNRISFHSLSALPNTVSVGGRDLNWERIPLAEGQPGV